MQSSILSWWVSITPFIRAPGYAANDPGFGNAMKCETDRDAPLTLTEKVLGTVGLLSPVIGVMLVEVLL